MYGYKMHPTEKNRIIVDEKAAENVKRIFSMALEGLSCRKIAERLNSEGVVPPSVYCGRRTGVKGKYSGLWSSERISEMLQNETYIGNMVQGKSVKISYKVNKSLKQGKDKWIIVEGTHEPIVDREIFEKVQALIESRRSTRSRTYDFLLKGLIFCHECKSPMAVINRKTARGDDRLFFVCRTYQRFTKAGVCTCHSIKEDTVNEAVISRVNEICRNCFDPEKLKLIAENELENSEGFESLESEIQFLSSKISSLTSNLDQMYMDRLNKIITEDDFARIYEKIGNEIAALKRRKDDLTEQSKANISQDEKARGIVERFIESACTRREVLVSLIERVELTEKKEIIIKFRFGES